MSKLSPEERAKLEAEIKEDQARLAAEKQANARDVINA